MSERAVFGDFAQAARRHLAGGRQASPADQSAQVRELADGLARLVPVLGRYCDDLTAAVAVRPPGPWQRAARLAAATIRAAAATLEPPTGQAHPEAAEPSPGLQAAAQSLAAGCDLLHTHFGTSVDGHWQAVSEWAPLITSPAVTRALLLELGMWSRLAARHSTRAGCQGDRVPSAEEIAAGVRKVDGTCQHLAAVNRAISSAQRLQPASRADIALLHSIPVNMPPLRVPAGTATCSAVIDGITKAAERTRRAARNATPAAAWSADLTAESLGQAAAHATIVSHNCAIILHGLAEATAGTALSGKLRASAETAQSACSGWLQVARAWRHVTTDTRGITAAAEEAAELALWTGRLAYASPAWRPQTGPGQNRRENVAGSATHAVGGLAQALGAVHQACEAICVLADEGSQQVTAGWQAGRLVVPARTVPAGMDSGRLFIRAPAEQAGSVLTCYQLAQTASTRARDTAAHLAASVSAPSRALTVGRAYRDAGSRRFLAVRSPVGSTPDPSPSPPSLLPSSGHVVGPVERALHQMGVTRGDLLKKAVGLDEAAAELILKAAGRAPASEPVDRLRPVADPQTAQLITDAYLRRAAGGRRARVRPRGRAEGMTQAGR